MPGRDGPGVFRDIRTDAATENIPIFIVTGVVDFRQLMYQKSVQAPEGFIRKPIDKDALLMNVRRILEKVGPAGEDRS
jgi:CheY-like chemotaxis protein